MTSLNMESCTQFDVPRPRKKARRSCLYCQKAHKTCGNERPCGQCVKRKTPSQCVDGNRKPPKYLNENAIKRRKAGLHRGFTSMQQSHYQDIIRDTTSYDIESTQQEDIDDGQIRDYRRDPFEEVFDELIDSNFFYTERSSSKVETQGSGRTIVKENENFIPFFSNAEYSTWSERSSSVSEDSEVGTSSQALEDHFGARLSKLQRYARDEPCSGFAISSGWSSTFFPHGIE